MERGKLSGEVAYRVSVKIEITSNLLKVSGATPVTVVEIVIFYLSYT
jgi:hypothetical protein